MKTEVYNYGEHKGTEEITKGDLKTMEELGSNDLLGFSIRKKDRGKLFMADSDYIDRGADGVSVKYAYAIRNRRRKTNDKI